MALQLRTLRTDLAAALTAAGVGDTARIYTDPPKTLTPPALVIVPDDPWLEARTIGPDGVASVRVRLLLVIAVLHRDPAAATELLEQLIVAAWGAMPQGSEVGEAARPTVETVGSAELLTTSVPVAITATTA